jgi:hypothetical protein
MSSTARVQTGLLVVVRLVLLVPLAFAALLAAAGPADAQAPPADPRWKVLFRSDDPTDWDTETRGGAFAEPLFRAPPRIKYLRLTRVDTGQAIIIGMSRGGLKNIRPPINEHGEGAVWWSGGGKLEWKGRHLGVVEGDRHPYPCPRGKVAIATKGWDCWFGSGFGHKTFVNDGQYFAWRGQEIKRTAFEIAVTAAKLTDAERALVIDASD